MKIALFNLIKEGKMDEVFEMGSSFLEKMREYRYEWTTLQSKFHDKRRAFSEGKISQEHYTQQQNLINSELINLIEKIDTELRLIIQTEFETEQTFQDKLQHALIASYELEDVISVGASTVTYKAKEKTDGDIVAIRALQNDNLFTHTDAFEEVYQINKLNHRNIISVLGKSGKDDVPRYVIMEFVRGINIEKMVNESGPRPVSETKRMLISISDALYYLHKRRIFNADLRASSIIVDSEGEPMLSPFIVFRTQPESNYHQIVSNLTYMSYQRLNAIDHIDHTPQTNQFSLGVLAYLLIVGEALFQPEKMIDLIEERIEFEKNEAFRERKLSKLEGPDELIYIVRKLLSNDRFPNMLDVLNALKEINDESTEYNRSAQESYIRACSSNPNITLEMSQKIAVLLDIPSEYNLEKLAMRLHNTISLVIETNPEKSYLDKFKQTELFGLFSDRDTFSKFKKVLYTHLKEEDYLWEKKVKQYWDKTLSETFKELKK